MSHGAQHLRCARQVLVSNFGHASALVAAISMLNCPSTAPHLQPCRVSCQCVLIRRAGQGDGQQRARGHAQARHLSGRRRRCTYVCVCSFSSFAASVLSGGSVHESSSHCGRQSLIFLSNYILTPAHLCYQAVTERVLCEFGRCGRQRLVLYLKYSHFSRLPICARLCVRRGPHRRARTAGAATEHRHIDTERSRWVVSPWSPPAVSLCR